MEPTVDLWIGLAAALLAAGMSLARPGLALPLLVLSLPIRIDVGSLVEIPVFVLLGCVLARASAILRVAASRPLLTCSILALPLWVLLSSSWARSSWFAIRESGKWLALVLAALLAMADDSEDPRPLVAALCLSLLPSAAWALGERLHWISPMGDPETLRLRVIVLGDLVRGRALFYHPNRLAEFVEQVGMVLLSCAVFGPWRLLCAASAAVALAGIWGTGSSASLAVMGGGGLVVGVLCWMWREGVLSRAWQLESGRGWAAFGGLLLVAAATAALAIARQAWVSHGGLGPRGYVWHLAAESIRQAPWLGIGGGNWAFQASSTPLERFWFRSHAHSLPLHIWAELGVVGLAMAAVTFLVPIGAGFTACREASARRGIVAGACFGVLALLAHDLVHWFLRAPADGLMTGVLLGIAAGASVSAAKPHDADRVARDPRVSS